MTTPVISGDGIFFPLSSTPPMSTVQSRSKRGARRSDRQASLHHGPTPAMMKRALATGQRVALR